MYFVLDGLEMGSIRSFFILSAGGRRSAKPVSLICAV